MQTIKSADYKSFAEYLLNLENTTEQLDIFSMSWINDTLPKMLQFTKQSAIMSKKYAVVCTNPPYMNKLEGQLKKFVIDNYKPYSGDLFSVFKVSFGIRFSENGYKNRYCFWYYFSLKIILKSKICRKNERK